jgi:hypothetical protein
MSQPELRDALFIPQNNRENFKQIIAKRSDLVRYAGGRLAPSLANTYQYAGLVLGYAATGGDAGYYKAYAVGNTDGSQVAVGVLSEDANVGAVEASPGGPAGDGSEIVIIKEGDLLQGLLIGLDSNAITNMNGKAYVEHGTAIISIRA